MIDLYGVTVADLERDPYPVYKELRESGGVNFMPCLDVWMITSWAAVTEAATDPQRFPAHVERSPTDRALGGVSMMTTDGEPAKSRRRPFDPTFRPRAVEATMPEVFEELCDQHLDTIQSRGRTDLVTDYFEPISLLSLAYAMGIGDLADFERLKNWFSGLAAGVSNYEDDPAKTAQCDQVSADIDNTLRGRFEEKMANPDDSMISHLVASVDGDLEERLEFIMPSLKLMLLGGLQEPAHGGATIAFCLLTHPEQLNEVRDNADLVAPAVEEGLRWTAPIGNLLRGVAPGTNIGGVDLPDDARVILVVSSANRDREVWGPTADKFDIRRPKRVHMSFATGPHYCIGHHFARVQLRVAIGKLINRFPEIRLDPAHNPVFWGHEYRSPQALHVLV